MNTRRIHFFTEQTQYVIKQKGSIRNWIKDTIVREGFNRLGDLNIIVCSDEFLLEINQNYLNHDTLTDIITFDNSEEKNEISGEIYISIDRIKENALRFKVSEQLELLRVIIHGILHLCGYGDETSEEKNRMREKENFYLSEFKTCAA